MISRRPGTYADAITRILGNLSPELAAAAVGKSEGLVRRWSNPDDDALPSLVQAEQMDRAYAEAGCGPAPILAVYSERIKQAGAPVHTTADPLERLASTLKEVGEAADAWRAMQYPRLSINDAAEIEREILDAIEALENMRRDVQARGAALRAGSQGEFQPSRMR